MADTDGSADQNDPAVRGYLREPILRLLPEDPPDGFLTLPFPEQKWRGRIFLMIWAMGWPEEYSWWQALEQGPPDHVAYLKWQQSVISDAAIISVVRQREAEDAMGSPDALDAQA